jgi:hypothetical protein
MVPDILPLSCALAAKENKVKKITNFILIINPILFFVKTIFKENVTILISKLFFK